MNAAPPIAHRPGARQPTPQAGRRPRWLARTGIAAGALAVIGFVAVMLLNHAPPEQHKKAVQITLLRLPPPPPPPKPEEKPPEPPKIKEEVHVDTPRPDDKPQPAEQPPQGPLGVDAAGSGAGDGFGLVGNKGGRDITTVGGGGSGLSRAMFGNGAARFLAQELARNPKLKSSTYKIELLVWIAPDGHIRRGEIVKGSGNPEIDTLIRTGITEVGPYRQPVPADLPQPLRIRVTSADA